MIMVTLPGRLAVNSTMRKDTPPLLNVETNTYIENNLHVETITMYEI